MQAEILLSKIQKPHKMESPINVALSAISDILAEALVLPHHHLHLLSKLAESSLYILFELHFQNMEEQQPGVWAYQDYGEFSVVLMNTSPNYDWWVRYVPL